MAIRKKFGKKIKEEVYAKYNGKCYLCGNSITMDEMSIDHKIPIKNGGTNNIDNLMPSDVSCNKYKDCYSIDTYRQALIKLVNTTPTYLFKSKTKMNVAVQMGCLKFKKWNGVFYFEKIDKQKS